MGRGSIKERKGKRCEKKKKKKSPKAKRGSGDVSQQQQKTLREVREKTGIFPGWKGKRGGVSGNGKRGRKINPAH